MQNIFTMHPNLEEHLKILDFNWGKTTMKFHAKDMNVTRDKKKGGGPSSV